jgi:hypothetical protein
MNVSVTATRERFGQTVLPHMDAQNLAVWLTRTDQDVTQEACLRGISFLQRISRREYADVVANHRTKHVLHVVVQESAA